LKVAYLTDRGKHRPSNEDSLYVDEDAGLFILADGMGGHNAGEVASKLAVEATAQFVQKGLRAGKEVEEVFRDAFASANKSIFQKALNNPAWEEMGTTLLMAFTIDHQVIIGHVGDSRAYLISKGNIERFTEDDTFVYEWLKEGLITKEEARSHHARHGLTEALGVTDEVEVHLAIWPWEREACLLLSSDGLTDMIEDEEIIAIVESASDPQQACNKLVIAANREGGEDNITVILVCN
jgi:serine/threonine protein phosphatase PrpC